MISYDMLWLMKPDLEKKTPEFGSLVFFEIAYNDGLE